MSLFDTGLSYVIPVYNGAVGRYAPALEKWGYDTTKNALDYVSARGKGGGAPKGAPAAPRGKEWLTTFAQPVLTPVGNGVERAVEGWIRTQVEPEVTGLVVKAALGGALAGFIIARVLK